MSDQVKPYNHLRRVLGVLTEWMAEYDAQDAGGLESSLLNMKGCVEYWVACIGHSPADVVEVASEIEDIHSVKDLHRGLCGQVAAMLTCESYGLSVSAEQVLDLAAIVHFGFTEGLYDGEHLI